MKPAFQIIAGGSDVTATFNDRLLSLRIVDEDGMKADRLTLEIDNRDNRVTRPETNMPLDISLGFAFRPLTYIGRYVVDRIGGNGPNLTLRIGATAANMTGGIRAPRTRPWEDMSLPGIVGKIAAEAGLKPVVGQSLRAVKFAYLAQTSESNLHFLTRLAHDLDATCKPAGGTLLVQKRGEGLNAEGRKLEPVAMPSGRLSGWNWEEDEREVYKSVETEWGDTTGAKVEKVTAGSGTPVRRLRHVYPNQAEAERAANGELSLSGRAVVTGSFNLSGFEAGLFAGGQVALSRMPDGLDGTWHVDRVEHSLQSALITTFKARRARGQARHSRSIS